ncbi:phage major capsid protein [Salmonella enterica]|nr:phage major capsid protein [Salmonella enterica subsp. enterica]EGX6617176.1 phage major capsid protein [Salmonella enterica]
MPDFNRDGMFTRMAEVAAIDVEARTVELAFSSEIEVSRWYGVEILDHSPSSVRLERLNDGGALLVDHSWSDQVGVVDWARIDPDRRGRALVRFSRNPGADEIFQDVIDKIRQKVSVGYRVLGAKLEETRGDLDVYRVTDWEPYEISFVSVPADNSVGVGRSVDQLPINSNKPETGERQQVEVKKVEKILRDGNGNLVRALVDENGDITKVLEILERAGDDTRGAENRGEQREKNRVRIISEMGETYNARDLAMTAIKDGTSADAFQRQLLDHLNTPPDQRGGTRSNEPQPTGTGTRTGNRPLDEMPSPIIGMSDDEIRRYSIFNVVRALANPGDRKLQEAAAFEYECSRAAQDQYEREAQGILIPDDVLCRFLQGRAFNAGGGTNSPTGATTGSNLVATDFLAGSFIDLLRPRTTIMRLARAMGGLVGNVDIPKQTGGATAYWVGEGASPNESTPTIGQIGMNPKTVGAYTDITRRLLKQSTPDAEMIVRNDLVSAIALAIDLGGYYGTGSNHQPLGIVNYTGVNGVAFAAANPTNAEIVQMETEIAADNADISSMAYVCNAKMRGYAKTTPKFASGSSVAAAGTIWEPGNTMNGYNTEVTNQINTGDVIFGNFADLIVGLWGGLDLTVDPYTMSTSGGLRIVAFQDVDFVVRRTESFCVGRKAA